MRLFALLLLSALAAPAHRLDEYLQATLLNPTTEGIDVEIQFTPGVAVLPLVLAAIDRDHDGSISADEQREYAAVVVRDVELRVDGAVAPLSVVEAIFPDVATMRDGLGTIRLKLHSSRTGHGLRFENRHLPRISAYLVNCLAAPELHVGPQVRDELQRSIRFDYSLGTAHPPGRAQLLTILIGVLLLGRVAVLFYRQRHGLRHFGNSFTR